MRAPFTKGSNKGCHMLRWALAFFIIALIAALLGFTTIAGAAISIAKFLFFLFLAIFVVLLVLGLIGYGKVTR